MTARYRITTNIEDDHKDSLLRNHYYQIGLERVAAQGIAHALRKMNYTVRVGRGDTETTLEIDAPPRIADLVLEMIPLATAVDYNISRIYPCPRDIK